VERSTDGRSFKPIGTVKARGNTGIDNTYEFPDREGLGLSVKMLYYRIRQVDLDGKAAYSGVIPIPVKAQQPVVSVYPNPFNETLNLLISTPQQPAESDQLYLYTMDGRLIYSRKLSNRQNNAPMPLLDLPKLVSGSYVLKLNLNGIVESIVIVKQ
jgi:hypothetical protein